jgi:UDP-galactopyranose mutase
LKYLVVGAGFSGAVLARELAEKNHQVTIIEKRSHIGGNAFDFINEHGIRVHKYGPHLFHTNNKVVFDWLSRFTDWVPYKHKVKAILNNGQYVTLPVNKHTSKLVGKENIIETFVRPYSEKMWGMKLEEIDPKIINRVPIRDDENDLYFPNDEFQFMPAKGYSELFKNILNHPQINVKLNTNFNKEMEVNYFHIFNSMPIDEYYNFIFGELNYRSLKFHSINIPTPKILPVSQVNFTNNSSFTRMIEWKNIPAHGVNDRWTTITYEEPCDYKDNFNERFYPVKDIHGKNRAIYEKYNEIENKKVTFIGRLGLYLYLDMHQCVNSSLLLSKKFI